jgi:hypothetical protein
MRYKALLAAWFVGVTAALGFVLSGCVGGGGAVSPEYAPKSPLTHWSNADWQVVLAEVVTPDGLVRYDALTSNTHGARDALFRYVASVNRVSPENRPDLFPAPEDRLAYYLNAYNALCMYGVLHKGLPSNVLLSGLFITPRFPVGGRETSLDNLEKQRVRSSRDVRVHFALSTMTRSSPPLRPEPYEGLRLDDQLAQQGRRYLSDPRGVQAVSPTRVRLSELLTRFYPGDFEEAFTRTTGQRDAGLIDALRPLAAPDSPLQTATEYQSMSYDWSLNRAG